MNYCVSFKYVSVTESVLVSNSIFLMDLPILDIQELRSHCMIKVIWLPILGWVYWFYNSWGKGISKLG